MLVLSRAVGEKVLIGDGVSITVVDIDRLKVRLGIETPKEVPIYREEVPPEALGLGATGRYPHGRISPDDQGELRAAIAADPRINRIRIEFGKPVTWLSITPEEAVSLSRVLEQKARELQGSPPEGS